MPSFHPFLKLLILAIPSPVYGNTITSAPSFPSTTAIGKTAQTNCDGVGKFVCPTGTCYTGHDGFVGCCAVSNCAARTTCLAYTSAVPKCNPDTDGCIACSAVNPYCVTITNVVANQYIMYCTDTISLPIITYAYINVATAGSMADPPSKTSVTGQSDSSTKQVPSTASSSSADNATPASTISAALQTGNSALPQESSRGLSTGIVAGISVGSVVAAVATICIIMALLRKRRKGKENNYEKTSARENSNPPGNGMGRKLQKASRSSTGITTTFANDQNDYLSPIERERLARINEARDAARVHEIDGSPSTANFAPSDNGDSQAEQKKNWWKPPNMNPSGQSNPSSRWSVSNAPVAYKAYAPNQNDENAISELPSIRHVPCEEDEAPRSTSAIGHINTDGVSPMLGGLSPPPSSMASVFPSAALSSNSQAGDRTSVGYLSANSSGQRSISPGGASYQSNTNSQPAAPTATIEGPIRWPETSFLKSSTTPRSSIHNSVNGNENITNNESEPSSSIRMNTGVEAGVNRSLTNAQGGGHKWISPEVAMSEGYSAGPEDRPTVPAKDT